MAAPGSPQRDLIKKPRLAQEFDGQVLRDLVLSETYGREFGATWAGREVVWELMPASL